MRASFRLESRSINAVSKELMNTKLKVTLALVSGIAIGALGIESLRAQSKPAGFLVAEFEVIDPVGWKSYQDGVRAMPSNGGVFLARAAKGAGLAGAQPKTITIVQFPTVEDAVAFDSSSAYTALKPLRDKSSNWRSYVVEGLPK
jgi:uncharacterized protein (DUF1330 family)